MMTQRKWTPGPWTLTITPDGNKMFEDDTEWEITTPDEPVFFAYQRYYPSASENIHDAHLIAAAPDLYEALAECVSDMEECMNVPASAYAALAKARGET